MIVYENSYTIIIGFKASAEIKDPWKFLTKVNLGLKYYPVKCIQKQAMIFKCRRASYLFTFSTF